MLYPALASGILYLISVKIVIALPIISLGFLLSAWPVPLLAGMFGTLSFLLALSSVNSLGKRFMEHQLCTSPIPQPWPKWSEVSELVWRMSGNTQLVDPVRSGHQV